MSTRIKLADVNEAEEYREINWAICVLCQYDDGVKLVDPFKATGDKDSGYATLSETLPQLRDMGQLPFRIDFNQLDEGLGIKQTLKDKHAQWHKNCYNRCSRSSVKTATK